MILEAKNIKFVTVCTFPASICHEVTGPDAMILVFWMLSFKPAFSLSSFTLIKRLFSSSSLSAIRVLSSAYLGLLISLLALLTPACDSFNLSFCLMHSEYKLNKQGDNILPYYTPFPILTQSVVPCLVLYCCFLTSLWVTASLWRRGLLNSVKLWARLCRVTWDGWVIVKSSDKTWFTGEGNGKPL